jgi:hypothetical protein
VKSEGFEDTGGFGVAGFAGEDIDGLDQAEADF